MTRLPLPLSLVAPPPHFAPQRRLPPLLLCQPPVLLRRFAPLHRLTWAISTSTNTRSLASLPRSPRPPPTQQQQQQYQHPHKLRQQPRQHRCGAHSDTASPSSSRPGPTFRGWLSKPESGTKPTTITATTNNNDNQKASEKQHPAPVTTMLADLRILTPATSDTPQLPPVVVQMGAERYLFNAGEGTMRSCTQRRANLGRVTNIFVPRVGWDAVGGLPGVLMTLADGNRQVAHLYGPANLRYLIASMRTFAKRDIMRLHIHELPLAAASDAAASSDPEQEPAPIFEDQHMAVRAVTLLPEGFSVEGSGRTDDGAQIAKRPRLDADRRPSSEAFDEEAVAAAQQALQGVWDKPGFNPSQLRGAKAEAWIRMVAESVFNETLLAKRQRAAEQGVEVAELDSEQVYAADGPGAPPLRTPVFVHGSLPASRDDLIVGSKHGCSVGRDEVDGQAPVLAFICEAHPQRGKFDPAKAAEAGVSPGPHFSLLTRGEDIVIQRPKSWVSMDKAARKRWTDRQKPKRGGNANANDKAGAKPSKNGKGNKGAKGGASVPAAAAEAEPAEWTDVEEVTVRSHDVVGPSRAGVVFMQIYLPSVSYLASLLSAESERAFRAYTHDANAAKPAEQRRTPHVVVHAVPLEVLRDERYQRWIARFGPECHHIVSNGDVCANRLAYPSSATIALRLSKLDDELYRVPQYQLAPRVELDEVKRQSPILAGLQLHAADVDQLVQLQPRAAPLRHRSGAPDFDFELGSQQAEKLASFELEAVEESQEQRAHTDKLKAKNQKAVKAQAQAQVQHKATAEEAAEQQLGAVRQVRLQEARKRAWNDYLDAVAEAKRALAASSDADAGGGAVAATEDLLVTTLGTGSAMPSKYRNVISTLVQTPHDGNLLLDAGESTYGLLKRKFGCHREGTAAAAAGGKGEDVDAVLRNLRCLFISHIHADHHLGLVTLLRERRKLQPPPERKLYLVATTYMIQFLREYSRVEALGLDEEVVAVCNEFLDYRHGVDPLPTAGEGEDEGGPRHPYGKGRFSNYDGRYLRHDGRFATHLQLSEEAKASLGLAYLHTARVEHAGNHCFGLVVRHTSGWSVAYSGDTRPCASLIAAGRDVSLLIHEASLEDGQLAMAKAKGHSTFGEAVDVGRYMRAKNLLLTHFSQRYPKLAPGARSVQAQRKGEEGGRKMPVVLAFDLVTFPLAKFEKVQGYTGALEKLFQADVEEEEGKGGEEAGGEQRGKDEERGKDEGEGEGEKGRKTSAHKASNPSTTTTTGSCTNTSGDANAATITRQAKPQAHPQRKTLEPNYAYLELRFTSSAQLTLTPTLVQTTIKTSLDQLLGAVNGAFHVDILSILAHHEGARVLLRCDARFATDLATSLSVGPDWPLFEVDGKHLHVRSNVHGPCASIQALQRSRDAEWS
ncbi:hypothetical protein ACQY0O_001078 [Thecaphora frezii]